MKRRLPVRWRLTLWNAALLTAVLALFGAVLYVGLRLRLDETFDEQLQSQAAVILATIRVGADGPALTPAETGFDDGEYFVRLVDASGRPIPGAGSGFGRVPVDPADVSAALRGRTRLATVSAGGDEEDEPLRIVTVPVRNGAAGPIVGALQVGLDRHDLDEALNGLLATLALAGPLLLLVTVGGGYFLAGRALAPVAAITHLAAGIGGRDLDARLGLDLPDDELGRLARTFDGMLARIEEAFGRQRRFTGDAAHELRTPLSLMRAQVDLALSRPRSAAEYREALSGIDADLERLTGLVGMLLTIARADVGRLLPDFASFDVGEIVAALVEQYAPLAQTAGVTLRHAAPPTPLVADEDLMIQLLVNFIDNALAHTSAGGQVTVGCRPDGGRVRVWVADTGVGIPPEHHARVFDRFARVDAGRARSRGGVGLGLAICRAIAEAHGGEIDLRSAVGRGTTVELRLPRHP